MKFSQDPSVLSGTLARRAPGERKTVLLLGANGFIGMHVLRELLDDDRISRVYALIRSSAKTSATDRLARQLRKYRMPLPDNAKLTVYQAGFTEPWLGLDPGRYFELCSEVDAVVDASGATNHTYSYARYRKEKLAPLLSLVDFCYQRRQKSLHLIGSVGSEVYKSRRDFFRYSFFHCGYSKMKWVIKHLGLSARRSGVPVHTYQTPFVLGGPHTGFKDPGMQYSIWHMLWYTLQTGQIWESDARIPIVSADVLARSVLANMCAEHPQDLVYPVTPVTTAQIAERLGLELVPWQVFRRTLTRRFPVTPRHIDWTKPWSSARRELQHALFTRSLFPRSLPAILANIDVTVTPMTGPLVGRIPPVDVLLESARQIGKLKKQLPVEAGTEMVEIDEKVA